MECFITIQYFVVFIIRLEIIDFFTFRRLFIFQFCARVTSLTANYAFEYQLLRMSICSVFDVFGVLVSNFTWHLSRHSRTVDNQTCDSPILPSLQLLKFRAFALWFLHYVVYMRVFFAHFWLSLLDFQIFAKSVVAKWRYHNLSMQWWNFLALKESHLKWLDINTFQCNWLFLWMILVCLNNHSIMEGVLGWYDIYQSQVSIFMHDHQHCNFPTLKATINMTKGSIN